MGRLQGVQYWTITGVRRIGASFAAFVSGSLDFDRHFVLTPLLGITLLKNLQKALTWSKTQRAVADNASNRLPR
jgi:hypothetical protein